MQHVSNYFVQILVIIVDPSVRGAQMVKGSEKTCAYENTVAKTY